MNEKITTIDGLAEMIQRTMASKEDLKGMASKEDLQEFRREVMEKHDRIHSDIRDIKMTLGPLVRAVAAMEREYQELYTRVGRLERKVGIEK